MFGALQARQQLDYAREEGKTIRNPSTALFAMSSEDRYRSLQERRSSPSYPFKFLITKNESLMNGFFTRLAMTEFRMLWSLPNIANAFGTNKLLIDFDDPLYDARVVLDIADGFYTPKELAAAITAEIANQGGYPIAVVFEEETGTFIFNATTPVEFRLFPYQPQYFATYNPAIAYVQGSMVIDSGIYYYASAVAIVGDTPGSPGSVWVPLNNTVGGLPEWNPTSAAYQGTQLFDMLQLSDTIYAATTVSGVPDLRWTDYVDIVCPQLTYQQELKDTTSQPISRDVIARIYLDESVPSDATYAVAGGAGYGAKNNGCRPFTIYRQFPFPKQIRWSRTQPIGQAEFELYDDQGRSIQSLLPPVFINSVISMSALSTTINFSLLISED
jgi:hypothetical protein